MLVRLYPNVRFMSLQLTASWPWLAKLHQCHTAGRGGTSTRLTAPTCELHQEHSWRSCEPRHGETAESWQTKNDINPSNHKILMKGARILETHQISRIFRIQDTPFFSTHALDRSISVPFSPIHHRHWPTEKLKVDCKHHGKPNHLD